MKGLETLMRIFSKDSKENIKSNLKDMEVADTKKQKRYQWIKGDRFGDIVEVAEQQPDSKWLYFTDGSRINPSLRSEFLLEIENDNQILKVKKPKAKVEQVQPVEEITPVQEVSKPAVVVNEPTVMGKMIEKMSKKNVVNVPLDININIPTPAIYAMLSEGMEAEDLNEEIMSVALAQIEINKLQEYIKEQITNFLIEYYG